MIRIDLRKDAGDVQALLAKAVREYCAEQKGGRHGRTPARRSNRSDILLGDGVSTPWVHLNFDTKRGSEPDCAPTQPDFARLTLEQWLPAVQAVCLKVERQTLCSTMEEPASVEIKN